jgi:hypothetical protein
MRKLAIWFLALGLIAAPAASAFSRSDDNKSGSSDSTKSTNSAKPADASKPTDSTKPTDTTKPGSGDAAKTDTKPANSTAIPSSAELATEIEQLRALILKQTEQLDKQQQELAEMQAKFAAQTTPFGAPAANGQAAYAPSGTPVEPSGSNVSSVPGNASSAPAGTSASAANPPAGIPRSAPRADEQHSPLSFKIGDALFTPGGFADLTAVYRTESTGFGIGSTFGSVPYVNTVSATAGPADIGETRFSLQNSRISLRVDAPVGSAAITGYVEADFLGLIAANANNTSNSDSLRMRLYFADYRRGKLEVLGGQDWSLMTPNRKGIGVFPNDIFYSQDMDTNYQVGLTWKRTPQFRVIYHANDSWAFAFSVENPDVLVPSSVTTPTLFAGTAGQVDTTSGGTLSTPPTPGFVPDFVFKVANDTKVGEKNFHIEAVGLVRDFRIFTPASIAGTNTTSTAVGVGGSVNLNLELFKNFHLIANSFWSDGGGIYLLASGPDIVIRQATTTSPFTPSPVHASAGIGGFEWQAVKSTMLYGYYGADYFSRNFSVNPSSPSGALVGYGYSGSAVTNNKAIQEGTVGIIQTFWQNPNYGKFQLITQGSYLTRDPWFVAATAGTPKNAHLFMAYVDLRYTLP